MGRGVINTDLNTVFDMTPWNYKNKPLTNIPEGAYGFVYLIENKSNNKKYIGKKLFWFTKTKQVNKKKKRIKFESDWKDYWSSSPDVHKDVELFGKDNFNRTILHICSNKGSCNYLEAREQMDRRVLETEEYYNGTIQCRIHKSHVKI